MATVTESRINLKHLPTGELITTPWADITTEESTSSAELTEMLKTFFESEDDVFVIDMGVYFAITRIVLQQCLVALEYREIEVTTTT